MASFLGPIESLKMWSTRAGLVGRPFGPQAVLRREFERCDGDEPEPGGFYDPRYVFSFQRSDD